MKYPWRDSLAGYCSICQVPEVYFVCSDVWEGELEDCGGLHSYSIGKIYIKRYCKECFEEYGGIVSD